MNNETLVIVPMKNPYKSKSRLKNAFSFEIRKRLAVQLYSNTLRVLNIAIQNMNNFKISVITKNEEISNIAISYGCMVIREIEENNLSKVKKSLIDNGVFFENIGFTQKGYLEIDGELKISTKDLFKINNEWYNNY